MLLANLGLLFVMGSDRKQAKVIGARKVDEPDEALSPPLAAAVGTGGLG
jgi:hypothetical protein